jgi:hypothetical protein
MSFICEYSGEQQAPKTKPVQVVVKKRLKYYPEERNRDNEIVKSAGKGWEIVKEINVAPQYAAKAAEKCVTVKS